MNNGPDEGAILERSRSLANESIWTVALQIRRLRTSEPEDETFIFRPWADWQFLIVALRRLRRAASIAAHAPSGRSSITLALAKFDASLPDLAKMRNVGEHIDDYSIDSPKRRDRSVARDGLQVASFDASELNWLGGTIKSGEALSAANELFAAVKAASDAHHA